MWVFIKMILDWCLFIISGKKTFFKVLYTFFWVNLVLVPIAPHSLRLPFYAFAMINVRTSYDWAKLWIYGVHIKQYTWDSFLSLGGF